MPYETPPDCGLFFNNERGIRIHTRHYLPPNGSTIKASIFIFHGYGAHVNRPGFCSLGKQLAEAGFAVFTPDQEGHGYSLPVGPKEETMATVFDTKNLVTDAIRLIKIARGGQSKATAELGVNKVATQLADVPIGGAVGRIAPYETHRTTSLGVAASRYFVAGQSMGGGIALLAAVHAQKDAGASRQLNGLAGAMLIAPALGASLPPAPVVWFMRNVVNPLVPLMSMPSIFDGTKSQTDIWIKQEDIDMIESCPLTFHKNMRFCTASALLSMIEEVSNCMAEVAFPFLVMHDPEDKVTRFEDSERLLATSKTPACYKELQRFIGCKHDVVTNSTDQLAKSMCDWATSPSVAEARELASIEEDQEECCTRSS